MRLNADQYTQECWTRLDEYFTQIEESNLVGQDIKLAYNRFRYSLIDERWEYKVDEVDKVFKFFSFININAKGDQFRLLPWQIFYLAAIFGFYHKGTETRRFTKGLLFMARKNGKTSFVAALQLYLISGLDDPEDPYSLLIASTAKQASIASKEAAKMVAYSPLLKKRFNAQGPKSGRNRILRTSGFGMMEAQPADSDSLMGLNPSSAILDEVHTYKNSLLYDAVITGTMARKNPITTLISTAGYLPEGFCAQMVETAARILRKEAEDDTFWIQIYRMDNGDEKLEPGNWTKPNPSIGELFSLDFLIQNWNSVKNLPISKRGFITMNLNEFVFGLENWIPEEDIEACFVEKRPDWITQGCDMFVGFDLSSVSDLTSVAYLFHEDNKFYLEVDSFTTPNEEKMIKGSTDIRPWIEGGYIKLCSSRVIDYDYVFDTIRRKSDGFNVVAIRYDLWNSTDLVKKLQETYGGVSVQPLKQYGLAINQSSKNFERKILEKQIQIQKNPVLRWNLRNVVIKEDEKGNIKLAKNTNADPIDGGIATIMALGAWASVYLSLYEA